MARPTTRKRTLTNRELEWEIEQAAKDKAKRREYYQKNKERLLAYHKEWEKRNPDKVKNYSQRHYELWKEEIATFACQYNMQPVIDPLTGETIKYNTLVQRKRKHPVEYANVIPKDCLVK